jgi:hypothetical protein
MKQLLMFLVMLSIPSVLHAAPLFKTIVDHNDSGTVPPEYHFSSTLTIVPDHANKTLSLEYEVEHSYGEGPGESYKNQIGKDWYDDDVSLLNGLKVCEGRPDAKERGIGGSTPLIHIVGDNLGALLKAGKAGEGALSITPDDICRNTKGWWDEWEKLAGRISSAVKASAKKEKAPVYRYLHVGKGEILLDIEIRSDLATRTAKVFFY